MKDKDDFTLSGGQKVGEGESPATAPRAQGDGTAGAVHPPADGERAASGRADIPAQADAAAPSGRDESGRFAPGHEKLGGREPGTKNKLDHHTKVMLKALVDHGLEDAQEVYDRIKAKQPRAALTILSRFAEYAAPKLARTEVVGEDGGPIIIEKRIHDSSDKDKE